MVDDKDFNPFDEENFASGGGLWDGKEVTILDSKTEVDRLTYKDGSPVLNKSTGEPAVRNVWTLIGIAEDEEKERKQTFSIGGLLPTPDGLGFQKPDGTRGQLHKNSQAARLATGLKAGGFDMSLLYKDGKPDVSALKGARLYFEGVDRVDRDGKVKVNAKGYTEQDFYPTKFLGFKEGAGKAGNGAVSDEMKEFATETVAALIKEAGGTVSRADLVRAIGTKLNGDARGPKVVQLVLKTEFSAGAPWTLDDTTFSLGA